MIDGQLRKNEHMDDGGRSASVGEQLRGHSAPGDDGEGIIISANAMLKKLATRRRIPPSTSVPCLAERAQFA